MIFKDVESEEYGTSAEIPQPIFASFGVDTLLALTPLFFIISIKYITCVFDLNTTTHLFIFPPLVKTVIRLNIF